MALHVYVRVRVCVGGQDRRVASRIVKKKRKKG